MALRMIEAMVPEEASGKLESLSEHLDVLGSWSERLGDGIVLLRVLVRSDRTEPVIAELEARFAGYTNFRIVLFQAEATLPRPPPKEKKAAPAAGDRQEVTTREVQRVAVAELVEQLTASNVVNRTYLLTVVLSTVVAAIGLMRDNVAVVIGAMVIAPLLSPNMTLAAATTLGDPKLVRDALWVNGVGVGLAAAISLAAGMLVPFDPAVAEIAGRAQVSVSDVVLALAAGSAGALAVTTGISAALVGVMVAVALLPPLVVAGMLLGAGHFAMGARGVLLLATNIICVNLAAVGTFLLQGVRPNRWWRAARAKRMVVFAAALWAILLVALLVIILVAGI
jgi:uncharacterized hydrophobic protein (TIGR00341 family)